MNKTDTIGSVAGKKVTWIGAAANAFLIAAKFIAGIYGHSQAMIADAVHSVSDFFTDAIVILGLRFGRKAPDEDHHFGHARIETLAAAVVGGSLLTVAIFLGISAAEGIYDHDPANPTWLALAGAALSIIVKEVLYQYTIRIGRRIKSPVVIANAWHHRSDALSSVAVLIGIAGAMYKPEWYVLDSFAALVVSFLIARVGVKVLYQALREMTDAAPSKEAVEQIRNCIEGVEGVIEGHAIKVRTSGGLYHVHVHIVVDGELSVFKGHQIAKRVEVCLANDIPSVNEAIVHVDPDNYEHES